MLSRIMRHPAGLVKRALGRNFLAEAFRRPSPPPAAPPFYWPHRYSAPGLVLRPAFRPAPGSSHVGAVPAFRPEAALLPAHAGKASSYLTASGTPHARR
jgi:hypothetical protein